MTLVQDDLVVRSYNVNTTTSWEVFKVPGDTSADTYQAGTDYANCKSHWII